MRTAVIRPPPRPGPGPHPWGPDPVYPFRESERRTLRLREIERVTPVTDASVSSFAFLGSLSLARSANSRDLLRRRFSLGQTEGMAGDVDGEGSSGRRRGSTRKCKAKLLVGEKVEVDARGFLRFFFLWVCFLLRGSLHFSVLLVVHVVWSKGSCLAFSFCCFPYSFFFLGVSMRYRRLSFCCW